MPIFENMCYTCRKVEEVVTKWDTPVSECPMCGSERKRLVSAPAKTAMKWGECWGTQGVNGVYDRGLGATYHTSMEREAICKAKGLVPLSEVGGDDFVTNRLAAEKDIKAQQDKILQTYLDKVEHYGGDVKAKVRAIEETLPANDCLGNEGNVAVLNANTFTGEKVDFEPTRTSIL